jgi:hypothetical protein
MLKLEFATIKGALTDVLISSEIIIISLSMLYYDSYLFAYTIFCIFMNYILLFKGGC